MIRLARLIVVVSALFAIAVSGALAVGRLIAQPTNLQTLGFGVCDGQPCFRDIVPGVTLWEEAQKQLSDYPVLDGDAILMDQGDSFATGGIEITVSGNRGQPVNFVSYEAGDANHLIPSAQFVDMFGTPCQITTFSNSGRVFFMKLYYSHMSAKVILSQTDSRLEPYSAATSWKIDPFTNLCSSQNPGTNESSAHAWRGFASLRRYGITTP